MHLMIKYEDLKIIATTRLQEAKALHGNNLFDGAAYLCGYVVETSLKARICKCLNIESYPDDGEHKNIFSTHNFDRLLIFSGLQKEISAAGIPELFANWSLLTSWKPERRYIPIGTYSKEEVEALFKALEDNPHGFLTWICTKW